SLSSSRRNSLDGLSRSLRTLSDSLSRSSRNFFVEEISFAGIALPHRYNAAIFAAWGPHHHDHLIIEQTHRPIVARPAHDGGVAIAGQGDGCTLGPQASSIFAGGTDQLAALLPPDTTAAHEYPCRPSRPDEGRPIAISVVGAGSTHDGGVAVRGQRNG